MLLAPFLCPLVCAHVVVVPIPIHYNQKGKCMNVGCNAICVHCTKMLQVKGFHMCKGLDSISRNSLLLNWCIVCSVFSGFLTSVFSPFLFLWLNFYNLLQSAGLCYGFNIIPSNKLLFWSFGDGCNTDIICLSLVWKAAGYVFPYLVTAFRSWLLGPGNGIWCQSQLADLAKLFA